MMIGMLHRLSTTMLFRREAALRTDRDIIVWWEAHRIPYNVIVGCAGALAMTVVIATDLFVEQVTGDPLVLPDPPIFALFAVIAYGVAANLCYTGGWILELMSRRLWPERVDAFGEAAFLWGTLGSIGLTLMPAVATVILGGLHLLYYRPS